MKRIPTAVSDLDGIVEGGLPAGSTVLLLGELGAGNTEFVYTSAAKIILAKLNPERRESLLGYTYKISTLPDKVIYISFSRSKQDILTEIEMAFSKDFFEAIRDNVEFMDFSTEYFSGTIVPSSWSGMDPGQALFGSGNKDLLKAFVDYMDSVPDNSMIIVDSLTDLLINEKIKDADIVMVLKGLQRVSKRKGGIVYLLLSRDIVDSRVEHMIVDSVDGVLTFTWSKHERSSTRRRYLYVEKFTSLFPHLRSHGIRRFVTTVDHETGYTVINMEMIS